MKYFLTTLLILFVLRLLFRLLIPVAFKQFLKKAESQQNRQYQNNNKKREDGQIRVEKEKNTNFDNNVEDIDFEEIK